MRHEFAFRSRRSTVHGLRGAVAASHPLAADEGLCVLREGGGAVDAAIAAAAVLCVVEPVSTGLGGDCFALVHEAATGKVHALNGSGRAPAAASADEVRRLMYRRMPLCTGHAVTVPGAVAAWCDLSARFGRLPLARLLAPAIRAAEDGFVATEWIAAAWATQEAKLRRAPGWESGDFDNGPPQESGLELLPGGRAPRAGEVVRLPTLARTLRAVAEGGREAIYAGDFPRRAAEHVARYGGWLAPVDFARHASTWVEPIAVPYRDAVLYECPPNSQGLAAALAAGIADGFPAAGREEAERVHLLVEAMRLSFADALRFVADPDAAPAPVADLLSPGYLARRRGEVRADRAARFVRPGLPGTEGDTVYLSVVDGEGNAASLIQSLYMGTGTGLVVPGTGVSLQNRGAGFSLDARHPNVLGPGKRPYHTIIPAMAFRGGRFWASFGVMGGFMQPQGHLQVLANLVDLDLSPQEALDAPRFQIVGDRGGGGGPDLEGEILVEDSFAPQVLEGLTRRGHRLRVVSGHDRHRMGGGQVILRDPATGALGAGSDPRKDGHASAF